MAAGIKFERNQVGEGHKFQAAAGTDCGLGTAHGILDHRGKPIGKTDDLKKSVGCLDIDDSSQGILVIRQTQNGVISGLLQDLLQMLQSFYGGVDAQVNVLGLPDILVGGQCDCPDDHGFNFLTFEQSDHVLRSLKEGGGLGHGS